MSITEDSGSQSDALTTESDVREPGLFDGLSAWFSSSVAHNRQQMWEENDGTVAAVDSAMYLFSEDADADDTKRLYNTDAYLCEHLAIFHPIFIDECVKAGSLKKTALGLFFLPPTELHKIIGVKIKFHWEILLESESRRSQGKEHSTSKKQTNSPVNTGTTDSHVSQFQCNVTHGSPSNSTQKKRLGNRTGNVDSKVQGTGSSDRIQPSNFRSDKRETTLQTPTDTGCHHDQRTNAGKNTRAPKRPLGREIAYTSSNSERTEINVGSWQHDKKRKSGIGEGCRSLPRAVTCQMVNHQDVEILQTGDNREQAQEHQDIYSDYIWVNDLPQVHGELWEFTVGKNGCAVHLKE